MKRKSQAWLRMLCVCVLAALILPVSARADMGPKPSVNIRFTGAQGVQFYGTLLSQTSGTGPYRAQKEGESWASWTEGRRGSYDQDYLDCLWYFTAYQDPDGFYLLDWCCDCTWERELRWGYYPPETFKLLLYFPQEELFCVSPVYERYAFDSYYTADLTDYASGLLTLEKSYDYTGEIFSLAVRIVLTIALELGLAALVFGWRDKKAFRFLAVVNIATQLFLNGALNVLHYTGGLNRSLVWGTSIWTFYLLEIVVIVAEGILYTKLLPRFSQKPRPVGVVAVYTIAANLLSMAFGLWLALRLPGLF